MSEPEATFEERKKCPKCHKPGEVRKVILVQDMPKGTKAHEVYCVSALCPWYDTCWIVQTNPDGSVPAPQDHSKSPKQYVGFEGHDQMARDLLAAVEADRIASQQSGTEIRRRRG